ncbi:hypothetical protein Bca101_042185 [Brassica carinata]
MLLAIDDSIEFLFLQLWLLNSGQEEKRLLPVYLARAALLTMDVPFELSDMLLRSNRVRELLASGADGTSEEASLSYGSCILVKPISPGKFTKSVIIPSKGCPDDAFLLSSSVDNSCINYMGCEEREKNFFTVKTHLFRDEILPSFFRDGSFLLIPSGSFKLFTYIRSYSFMYFLGRTFQDLHCSFQITNLEEHVSISAVGKKLVDGEEKKHVLEKPDELMTETIPDETSKQAG